MWRLEGGVGTGATPSFHSGCWTGQDYADETHAGLMCLGDCMCSEPRAAVGGRAAGCGRPTASAQGVAYIPLLSFCFSGCISEFPAGHVRSGPGNSYSYACGAAFSFTSILRRVGGNVGFCSECLEKETREPLCGLV